MVASAEGGGCLLTDEPGLGKTIQVIAVIEAMIRAHFIACGTVFEYV